MLSVPKQRRPSRPVVERSHYDQTLMRYFRDTNGRTEPIVQPKPPFLVCFMGYFKPLTSPQTSTRFIYLPSQQSLNRLRSDGLAISTVTARVSSIMSGDQAFFSARPCGNCLCVIRHVDPGTRHTRRQKPELTTHID